MNERAASTAADTSIVELRIPSKAEWVAVARLTVAAIASRLDFSLDEIDDLKLAIAEACTNAIQRDPEGDLIDLVFEARSDALIVTVRDRATGSHLETVEEELDDEDHVGGLGVFIIRSLMDEVDFRVDPRTGGRLVMTKKVTG